MTVLVADGSARGTRGHTERQGEGGRDVRGGGARVWVVGAVRDELGYR